MTDIRSAFSATAAGTNAGATATQTGATSKRFAVCSIAGWSDAASMLQILGGANGTTVVWEVKIAANAPFSFTAADASVPLYFGVAGQNVSAKIATSTAGCDVNIAGFEVATV